MPAIITYLHCGTVLKRYTCSMVKAFRKLMQHENNASFYANGETIQTHGSKRNNATSRWMEKMSPDDEDVVRRTSVFEITLRDIFSHIHLRCSLCQRVAVVMKPPSSGRAFFIFILRLILILL